VAGHRSRRRGKTFHADLLVGRAHVVRGSLGTRNQDAARRLLHRLETALAEGPRSEVWLELRRLLPREIFDRFAEFAGVKEQPLPMWADLRKLFSVFTAQRVKVGKFAESTVERYEHTFREFELFLSERKTGLLRDITVPFVEEFKVWRVERIKKRKQCRGGHRCCSGRRNTGSHIRVCREKGIGSEKSCPAGGEARRQSGRRGGAVYRG